MVTGPRIIKLIVVFSFLYIIIPPSLAIAEHHCNEVYIFDDFLTSIVEYDSESDHDINIMKLKYEKIFGDIVSEKYV